RSAPRRGRGRGAAASPAPAPPRAPRRARRRATLRRTTAARARTRAAAPRRFPSPAARRRSLRLPQLEPEVSPRRERQQVRQLADRREAREPEELDRDPTPELREVELDRLRRAGDVVDAEHDVILPAPDVREDARVLGPDCLVAAEAEDRVLLAERDEAVQPAQERGRRAELRLD